MVYCFLFSLFFSAVSLFADSFESHTFSKPSTKKRDKPTPKIISEITHNYFYAFGSYLYYVPNTDGLGYAITGVNSSHASSVHGLVKGNYFFPSQNPGSGFQAGVGSQIGYDKLIVESSFSTWHDHNLTKNQEEGPCESALFNGTFFNDENNIALWNNQINTTRNSDQSPLPLTYSYVDWTQRFYLFDFAIKADKLIGESFIIRPQVGVLFTKSKEFYTIHYAFDDFQATVNDLTKAKICSSQKSHSVGPKIGMTSLYYPLANWALYGQFFCTPALNYFHMKTQECATVTDGAHTDPTLYDIAVFNVAHKNYSLTPIIELGLGLEADLKLFSSPSKVRIGFDQKYFFSHNYIKPPDFNSLYTPTSYSTQGLNVSISLSPFAHEYDEQLSLDKSKTFLQPHYPRPTNRVSLSLEAEVFYPKPNVEGLAYAVDGINFIYALDDNPINQHKVCPGQVYNPVFSKEFAVKATVNAHLKYAALDLSAEIFMLPHIQVDAPELNFVVDTSEIGTNNLNQAQPLWFQDFSSQGPCNPFATILGQCINENYFFLQTASSSFTLDLKKYNFFHSTTFQIKDYLSLQTKFGLTNLKQKQSYTINYTYYTSPTFPGTDNFVNATVSNNQIIKALGPSAKIKSTFFLSKFFAFYGELELAAPYGTTTIDSSARASLHDATNDKTYDTLYWTISNKVKQIFPCILGEGGVKLLLSGTKTIHEISLALGYNTQAFLSNNFMQPVVNADVGWDNAAALHSDLSVGGYMNNSKGTLGLSGFTITMFIKF